MNDPQSFLTFQKFQDPALAEEIAGLLRDGGIECEVETQDHFFDPSFANNPLNQGADLKLPPQDFDRADKLLADYYRAQLDEIGKDYYLFDFTDEELGEIIAKPDEWGRLDYQLAQKILKDRGKEIRPEQAQLLKEQRISDLKKQEPAHSIWIYIGYLSAIFGGMIGIVIGAALTYLKKTLPNGERIYAYKEIDRFHGRIILFGSLISILAWWIFWGPQPALFGLLGPL